MNVNSVQGFVHLQKDNSRYFSKNCDIVAINLGSGGQRFKTECQCKLSCVLSNELSCVL